MSLAHPNLIGSRDIAAAVPLSRVLRAQRFSIADALGLGVQLAAALGSLHDLGVTYGDLDPSRVFVFDSRVVKVLRYPLHRGIHGYSAPEILRGRSTDFRADVFSIGAILSHAVTGRPPFPGIRPVEIAVAILHDRPHRIGEPGLACIVERCLEKKRSRRFASARELGLSLEILRASLETTTQKGKNHAE